MGALEFISSIVGSLAWPLAVLAIVFILRSPVDKLLTSRPIKSLKAGPGGVEVGFWEDALREAQTELAAGSPEVIDAEVVPDANEEAEPDEFLAEMKELAQRHPAAAVLESFRQLERVIREELEPALASSDIDPRRVSVRNLAREAFRQGLISAGELAALDNVVELRNAVTHGVGEVDTDRAVQYAEVVRQLMISILMSVGRTSASMEPRQLPGRVAPSEQDSD